MAQKKKIDRPRALTYAQALQEIARLRRREAELEWDVNQEWCFNVQQCIDCMVIALHIVFGFGPERNKRLVEEFKTQLIKWMQMSLKEVRETEQGKDCHDFWETQGKMDRAVRAALGDDVPDWEQRYDEAALTEMLRDLRRIKKRVLTDE